MMPPATETTRLYAFEDIIDGYFPLRISLMQMLERLGTPLAYVEITHAPIMQIPGLPHDAPVPLNIRAGRAGVIDRLHLRAEGNGALSGAGSWRWLDGSHAGDVLDPMTRLAEPVYLWGFCPAKTGETSPDMTARCFTAPDPRPALPFWGPFDSSPSPRIVQAGKVRNDPSNTSVFLEIVKS